MRATGNTGRHMPMASFTLSPNCHNVLRQLAEATGLSKSEIVERCVLNVSPATLDGPKRHVRGPGVAKIMT